MEDTQHSDGAVILALGRRNLRFYRGLYLGNQLTFWQAFFCSFHHGSYNYSDKIINYLCKTVFRQYRLQRGGVFRHQIFARAHFTQPTDPMSKELITKPLPITFIVKPTSHIQNIVAECTEMINHITNSTVNTVLLGMWIIMSICLCTSVSFIRLDK